MPYPGACGYREIGELPEGKGRVRAGKRKNEDSGNVDPKKREASLGPLEKSNKGVSAQIGGGRWGKGKATRLQTLGSGQPDKKDSRRKNTGEARPVFLFQKNRGRRNRPGPRPSLSEKNDAKHARKRKITRERKG